MAAPGRNDPCPCGSGKKFKHCHLLRAQPPTGITVPDRTAAFDALLRYSGRDEFAEVVEDATLMWAGQDPDGDSADALDSIFEFDTSRETFFDWLFFDLTLEDQRTMAHRYLERRGRSLHPRAEDYVRLMLSTHLRAYQVRESRQGEGLLLRDLWQPADRFVSDRSASQQLVVWDVLVARVVAHADGTHQIEGSAMVLPPSVQGPIVKSLKSEHRRLLRKQPDLTDAQFFKMVAPVFHLTWYDNVAMAAPPDIRTSEGDPIMSSTLEFDVPRAGEALVTLLREPDFDAGEFGAAVWLDPGGERPLVLGEVQCDHGRLTLTTISRERAARGRARLEALLGPLPVLHEEYNAPGAGKNEAPDAATSSDDGVSIDDVPELAEYVARQDRAWLDLEIPALDGSTPRAAARNRRMRPRLVELLIDIENREARLARNGQARDVTWLWNELGLTRP